jgi:hypothetical protein
MNKTELREALDRVTKWGCFQYSSSDFSPSADRDAVVEWAVRDVASRDHESTAAPTRELFERLGGYSSCLWWSQRSNMPRLSLEDSWVDIDTITKLRAACLLIGIDWPEDV